MPTGIKWTKETLNLVVGCHKVSPGCAKCYAEAVTKRWPDKFPEGFRNVTLKPERLEIPRRWKKPRLVFVNSMSDTFHDDVPDDYLREMWAMFADTPQHTYQILTKRPERMAELCHWDTGILPWLTNVWLGVSAENQKYWDERVPYLQHVNAGVKFVSCEPLLGPINIWALSSLVHWIIVGGESGPGRRPFDRDWARNIRDRCQASGIPFFYKQGSALHAGKDDLLDGVEHKEIPDWDYLKVGRGVN